MSSLTVPGEKTPKASSTATSPNQKRKLSPLTPTRELPGMQKIGTSSATGNPRNKCALKPGHSLMDWIRLGSSGADLTGTRGAIFAVSHTELAKHCKQDDAWIAIRGKVYNVTKYMDFHPGGIDELMKGVGQDATKMFDEVHAWVNYEQLLAKCFIGPLRNTATVTLQQPTFSKSAKTSPTNGGFKPPPMLTLLSTSAKNLTIGASPLDADAPTEIIPRFDWIQKTAELIVVFYTKSLCNPGLQVECMSDTEIEVRIMIERTIHVCSFTMAHAVRWPCVVRISYESGKIEMIFQKAAPALWTNFGLLDRRKSEDWDLLKVDYDVVSRVEMTYDSFGIVMKSSRKRILQVIPIGYHVSVTAHVGGHDVTRSYTPVPFTYLPIASSTDLSSLSFIIKRYDSGILSKHLTQDNPTASNLVVSGAKGSFALYKLKKHSRVALLVAGSGLTPVLSLLDYLLQRNANKLEAITILFFNKSEADIWCRAKLDEIIKRDERVLLEHILSEANADWCGPTGRVTDELVKPLTDKNSPKYSTFACVCGPTPFNQLGMELLRDCGMAVDYLHLFYG